MKWINMMLVFVIGVAFAGGKYAVNPTPPFPYVLWQNQYDYELLTQSYGSSGEQHSMDDFVIDEGGLIESFECWGLFVISSPYTHPCEVTIYKDRPDHTPGVELWSALVTMVSCFDTGDDNPQGYDIWFIELFLEEDDYFQAEAGVTYWLEIYWTTGWPEFSFSWCAEDNGNMRVRIHGDEWDTGDAAFFRILGSPGSGIEESTWGEVKARGW
jgi:hypothetical protein